jgi:hypothetical protein
MGTATRPSPSFFAAVKAVQLVGPCLVKLGSVRWVRVVESASLLEMHASDVVLFVARGGERRYGAFLGVGFVKCG